MKKSRIIALLTAAVMIMSTVPAFASVRASVGGYFVDAEGVVYEKSGENMITNPGFEDGLTGLTQNDEYYEVSQEAAHSGANSLKAIKSTKGEGAITAYFAVEDPNASYYLSFWYKNIDTVARRPRVTFAFTDSSKVIPTEEDDFTEATNAWVGAGTASNDSDMEYSKGEWVQYSTVLNGNGNADACKYVAVNIYGLTKNVAFVDDFELYELTSSDEYSDKFADAVAEWETKSIPHSNLAGFGTIDLPREVNVPGIGVEWSSSSVVINAATGEYSSGAEEEIVILTARLFAEGREDIYYEYEYPIIVKSMFVPYVEWINTEVFGKIGSAVNANLNLPTSHTIEGYYPATITWNCSDEAILDAEGNFTAPETTKYVDLVATIECNGETTTTTKRLKAIGGNIVSDGLIMYYDFEKPLDSKKTVFDNSQKDNVYNAKAEGIEIVDGYARFLNAAAIILPSNYATELTGSYSVSMWVNLDKTIASSGGMYRFFDFGGDTMTSQFLRYIPGSGQLSFMDRGTAPNKDTFALDTTVTGLAQTWNLISFTYDFTSSPALARVYVNGKEIATSGNNNTLTNSISTIAGPSSTRSFIGRTQWYDSSEAANNPDFMGLMDDIRIYNRAITAEEITTLYNETRPTVTAPVTIKFQDVNGETLKEDVTVSVDVDTTYDVPASYKSIPSSFDGQYRLVYKYLASQSIDSVYVSADSENVCTLIFQLEKQAAGTNLIANPSFEEGVDGWTSNNNGALATISGWVRSTDVAHDGSYSLKRNSDVGKNDSGNFGTYIPIETGKIYNLSFWEYCDSDVAAGSHMMSAVCIAANQSAVGDTANHLLQYGGYSSWVNEANGTAPRDVAYSQGWTQRTFTFDTTGATNANYIFIAYTWKAGGAFYVDDFVLEEVAEGDVGPVEPDDSDKIPVTIKYVDIEGNTIKDDVIVKVDKGTNDYIVPDSYKSVEDKTEGSAIYKYTYNAQATAKIDNDGGDIVSISILRDNVATLVFDTIKADKNSNLMVDGDFMGDDGKFSWGTWMSPETSTPFATKCEDWFYQVNRDTNASALYLTGVTADDYALGTRWNDGTAGLCSMANFVPVEKGKTYIISYDYKHSNPSAAQATYISTSFVTTKSIGAGAATGSYIPQNVSTTWQTNTFTITAPSDGFIYFHFSYLGESNNKGNGPFWYFDNFEVLEVITFENEMTYVDGYAEIIAEDGTEGYLIQATYNEEGALTGVVISDKLTLNQETATKVAVQPGVKLMLVKDLVSLEPLAPSIIAE